MRPPMEKEQEQLPGIFDLREDLILRLDGEVGEAPHDSGLEGKVSLIEVIADVV